MRKKLDPPNFDSDRHSIVFNEDQIALPCSGILEVVVPDGLNVEVGDAARMASEVFLVVNRDVGVVVKVRVAPDLTLVLALRT